MKALTPKQATFVAEYLKHGNQTKAAIAAGYAPKDARISASRLIRETPAVREAISNAQKKLIAKGEYNLQTAMEKIDEAIEFAKQTENANAYMKGLELQSKLNGLLVEKHDVRQSGFVLNIHEAEPAKRLIDVTNETVLQAITHKKEEEDDDDPFS